MNDMTNENQLIVVKEYEFDKTDIHEIDYILDDVIKDCRKSIFIHLNIEFFMIFALKIFLIMKKSILQLLIDRWSLKLNSMV